MKTKKTQNVIGTKKNIPSINNINTNSTPKDKAVGDTQKNKNKLMDKNQSS